MQTPIRTAFRIETCDSLLSNVAVFDPLHIVHGSIKDSSQGSFQVPVEEPAQDPIKVPSRNMYRIL